YSVPRSNYLWHIDGHHKLIWWGIVIHGMIDGFCQTVDVSRQLENDSDVECVVLDCGFTSE
ncbi:hypothetical protein BDN67DRAFT_913766, partial [Paxillus ammoniavirescens]